MPSLRCPDGATLPPLPARKEPCRSLSQVVRILQVAAAVSLHRSTLYAYRRRPDILDLGGSDSYIFVYIGTFWRIRKRLYLSDSKWSAPVDDFRTFQGLDISLGSFSLPI